MATTPPTAPEPDDATLLRPGQVAARFQVSPKTVSRWGEAGILPVERTPGGHRRFRWAHVRVLLAERRTVGEA